MKFRLLTSVLFVFFALSLKAQEPVLSMPEDVIENNKKIGPNKKHSFSSKFSFGINAPLDLIPNMSYAPFRSWNAQFGVIYKYRVSNYFALLAELAISGENMVFNQDANQVFNAYPSAVANFERLMWNRSGLDLNLGFRINYEKNRGNHLGKYLDLGVIGGLALENRWEYHGQDIYGNESAVVLRGPDEVNLTAGRMPTNLPVYYGAYARLGFNKIAVTVRGVQYTQERFVLLPGIEFIF